MLTVPEIDKTEFTFYFNRTNPHWSTRPEYNHLFLRSQIQYFNDRLQTGKPLFLNDVLSALGLNRLPAGQILGWKPGSCVRVHDTRNAFGDIELQMVVDGNVLHHL